MVYRRTQILFYMKADQVIFYRNESFTTKVFSTSALDLLVRDHNTLSDTDIGETTFSIAEHVDEGRPFDGWLPLTPHGNGELHIQVQVVAN